MPTSPAIAGFQPAPSASVPRRSESELSERRPVLDLSRAFGAPAGSILSSRARRSKTADEGSGGGLSRPTPLLFESRRAPDLCARSFGGVFVEMTTGSISPRRPLRSHAEAQVRRERSGSAAPHLRVGFAFVQACGLSAPRVPRSKLDALRASAAARDTPRSEALKRLISRRLTALATKPSELSSRRRLPSK